MNLTFWTSCNTKFVDLSTVGENKKLINIMTVISKCFMKWPSVMNLFWMCLSVCVLCVCLAKFSLCFYEYVSLFSHVLIVYRVFLLPVSILLLLMCEIMVSVSYYIFVLGMYFSTASSMKYLYIFGVAYLVFVALLFPLVLFVVAVVNVMLYSNGKSYYVCIKDTK